MYSTVYHLTLRGWPKHRQQVLQITRHFWGFQDVLSIDGSLLLKGTKVCMPPELLDCTLNDLHGVHQGINRMQAQAREAVYWPGIDTDIGHYVGQCTIFTRHKASPSAQPMLPRDIPDGLWQGIAASYLTHKGREYLLVCNLFSKYPFLYKISTNQSNPYVCTCKSSSCSTDHLVCCTLTMGCPLHLKGLHSSCSTTTLTM